MDKKPTDIHNDLHIVKEISIMGKETEKSIRDAKEHKITEKQLRKAKKDYENTLSLVKRAAIRGEDYYVNHTSHYLDDPESRLFLSGGFGLVVAADGLFGRWRRFICWDNDTYEKLVHHYDKSRKLIEHGMRK